MRMEKKNYLPIYLEECEYKRKKIKISELINIKLESDSSSGFDWIIIILLFWTMLLAFIISVVVEDTKTKLAIFFKCVLKRTRMKKKSMH